MLLVREIDLYERWTWHLLEPKTDTEVRLRGDRAPDRTLGHRDDASGRLRQAGGASASTTSCRPPRRL